MTPLQSMTFFVLALVLMICLLYWLIDFLTWVVHRRDVDVDVASENSDPETATLPVRSTSDEPYDYEIHGL
ncbi:MAG: hypothetical protein DI630_27680 [Gordonia sp. (in: high G+C Gram-positive bacteria)]|nr:MAG: hypothetical protein DI630_27680 [Gordonia sp. (in: high G+C Gram-positive bacteria)]